jgi:hypothetical protein
VPHGRAHAAVRRDERAHSPAIVAQPAPAKVEAPKIAAAKVEAPKIAAAKVEAPQEEAPAAASEPAATGERTRRRRRRRGEPTNGAVETGKEHVEGTIDTSNGREFWEAWVDSKNGVESGPSEPSAAARQRTVERDAEEGEGRRRRERRPRNVPEVPAGQARLYLNLGRRDGAEEEQVRAVLAEHQVEPRALDVMSSHSYLNVDEAAAEDAIARLSTARFGERALKCERAKP